MLRCMQINVRNICFFKRDEVNDMTGADNSLERKLKILADAAKYDVACTSSGSSRRGKKGHLGNAVSAGICHTFSSDGRCVSLLKILFSNDCIFDCKYCPSRVANERERATFTPEEICRLVVEFYRRNYIEGLFLSSAVVRSPAYTMEKMYEAIYMLRNQYHFNGYVHVKAIPGAPDDIIYAMGFLVDRMSVNLELPTTEGLKKLAPNKKPQNLIRPMRQIQKGIVSQRLALGKDSRMERAYGNKYLANSIFNGKNTSSVGEKSVFSIMEDAQKSAKNNYNVNGQQKDVNFFKKSKLESSIESNTGIKNSINTSSGSGTENSINASTNSNIDSNIRSSIGNEAMVDNPLQMETGIRSGIGSGVESRIERGITLPSNFLQATGKRAGAQFVPAGQSTQMIIGASGESDFHLLSLTQRLYQQYDLKRIFYSAYVPLNDDPNLPAIGTAPPLLREHRLYQADWLLRYYGFQADELLSPDRPNFNTFVDPKCDWALRHLEYFPVEINQATYEQLLRVPGIGNKSAGRIVRARRQATLDFEDIRKMGVVLKRAVYFITCRGKMKYHTPIEEDFITRQLIGVNHKDNWNIEHPTTYRQLSLFDDFHLK